MDKILIAELGVKTVGNTQRNMCLVECPDCSSQREIRQDSFKAVETTCCRSCVNLRRPTKPEEELFDWKSYYHSKVGKLAHLFQTQRVRCKEKGWDAPIYTQEELTEWGMSLPKFHDIFDAWVASDFQKSLSPSIDRLDDYKSYSLSNIRLVTWQENNDKGRYWQVIGLNTKNSIAVDQLTLNGRFIKRFHSVAAAGRALEIDNTKIGQVCRGLPVKKGNRMSTPKTAGGYMWRYSSVPNPPA